MKLNPHRFGVWAITIVTAVTMAPAGRAHILPLESRLGGLALYDPNQDVTFAENLGLRFAEVPF